jgi:hypothetical protein
MNITKIASDAKRSVAERQRRGVEAERQILAIARNFSPIPESPDNREDYADEQILQLAARLLAVRTLEERCAVLNNIQQHVEISLDMNWQLLVRCREREAAAEAKARGDA